MATSPGTQSTSTDTGLPANQAYGIAAICLLLGLCVGYFFLGSNPRASVPRLQPAAHTASATPNGTHPKLTLEQMKQMADVQASALIEKSKADPKNVALLTQIAGIYQATHQFKEAAGYFEKALAIDPKDVAARTELASCLYYSGDVDGALAQLTQALKYSPTDANSLFNMGMIKYRGKNDPKGAVVAWKELLKAHPDLDRKAQVEQMIAEAQGSPQEKN
jgi:cytochrome c-type biogenesis protein CcmH/NrfG